MVMGAGLLWVALGTGTSPGKLWAAPQAEQQKPAYTMAEYNAYKAADAEQNPQLKIKKLDDFVKQYTNSSLLPYVYRDFYLTNYALKNFAGAIEYTDRQLALGDKVDTQGRLEASVARAQAFLVGGAGDKSLQTPEAQGKARDAAVAGLKILDEWKKPEQMAADQYEQQKNGFLGLFNSVAGAASYALKDYAAATGYYKAVLAVNPNDAISHFRLGVAYLEMTPPEGNEGFWQLARSIALKAPNEQQLRTYLRNQLIRYQQTACDKLIDDQVNELITLAGSSADRPATLTIPSAAGLQKARDDTANFIPALKAGGDAGKVMWLASCGLEYPDVGVWAMSDAVADGDTITIRVYRPTSQDPDAAQKEIEAAPGPNMEIKITGQPEAIKIKKDDQFRFTGTLVGYTQSPFLLTWDKAKINHEDIPDEKAGPGKRAPARRAPAKKASDD